MQTARIIPYMERKTSIEVKRRSAEAVRSAWRLMLMPWFIAQAIWLTATGAGRD